MIDGGRAEAWDDHVARLIRSSLGCLQQAGRAARCGVPAGQRMASESWRMTWQQTCRGSLLRPLATALVSSARWSAVHMATASSCRWMATILLCPRASSGCDPCSKVLLWGWLCKPAGCPSRSTARSGSAGFGCAGAAVGISDGRGSVCTLCRCLPTRSLRHIAVSVVGPPRGDPHLKHSLWATPEVRPRMQTSCSACCVSRGPCVYPVLAPSVQGSLSLRMQMLHVTATRRVISCRGLGRPRCTSVLPACTVIG